MQHKSNTIRIIAGKYRSRRLHFPDVEGLRPTHDRIRETVFNWLQDGIVDSDCLDIFAGSGAFGFEAASRGANHIAMIDASREVVSALEKNKLLLKADNISIYHTKFQNINTAQLCKHYDIVFIDPPFANEGLIEEAMAWLINHQLITSSSLIYVEAPLKNFKLPDQCHIIKQGNTKTLQYFLVNIDI